MKTLITLEIEHKHPIPHLAGMIAGRAYTISGVSNAEAVEPPLVSPAELRKAGFSVEEIALGSQEIVR